MEKDKFEEKKGNVLIEGDVRFKQGLRSRWEKTFTSVYKNLLSVYTDQTKEIELFRFTPKQSWISSTSKSESGIFVLNFENKTSLYLFEAGSDLSLRTWLQVLSFAGWKSALVHTPVTYTTKPKKFFTHNSECNPALSFNSSIYSNNRDQSVEMQLLERSYSLPSLDKSSAENISAAEKRRSYMRLNVEPMMRSLRTSIAESGYCSKESLTIDSERLSMRQKKTLKQDQINIDLSEVFQDNKMVALSMDVNANGQKTPSITNFHTKVDIDNNLESLFKEADGDQLLTVNFEDVDDSDATPKLEKKASMSHIIFSLKSKFGSASGRKKGKKFGKRIARNDTYSSRLLWNPDGQWNDYWFCYEDGFLSGCKTMGYKNMSYKPSEVTIDVKNCILTSYNSDDVMRRLNIFKLTTSENVIHIFAAWTEEQYDSWIDVLNFAAERREDSNCMEVGRVRNDSEDVDDNDIIPYERALSNEKRKVNSSSSEHSEVPENTRVDYVDSGNDGDESGLESSISSIQKFEAERRLKKTEKERKQLGKSTSYESMLGTGGTNVSSLDYTDIVQRTSVVKNLRLSFGSKRQDSNTSTENDPMRSPGPLNVDIPLSNENKLTETKKKRPSFIHKQRWSSMFEHNRDADKNKLKKDESLQVPRKKTASFSEAEVRKPKLLSRGDVTATPISITPSSDLEMDFDSAQSFADSVDSPQSLRLSSTDDTVRRTHSSEDSNEQQWEVFDSENQFKKLSLGSEDENSDCCSVPSLNGCQVAEEQKQVELEDTLREETLLRKRRNSLTLERGHIVNELDAMKDVNTHKKTNKQEQINTNKENKKDKIENLEVRLEQIDSQIEIIDKNIDLRINPTYKQKKMKPVLTKKGSSNNIMAKLRKGKQKTQIDNAFSMSVESLVSNTSRDSSTGQVSPNLIYSKQQSIDNTKKLNKKMSDCSEASTGSQNSNSDLTGIEELMLTTQKLMNNNNSNHNPVETKRSRSPALNQQLSVSDKWRSKSVSAVDHINGRDRTDSGRKNSRNVNQNHTTAQSQLIIEDFEKFSAMLSDQMKQNQDFNGTIDV